MAFYIDFEYLEASVFPFLEDAYNLCSVVESRAPRRTETLVGRSCTSQAQTLERRLPFEVSEGSSDSGAPTGTVAGGQDTPHPEGLSGNQKHPQQRPDRKVTGELKEDQVRLILEMQTSCSI